MQRVLLIIAWFLCTCYGIPVTLTDVTRLSAINGDVNTIASDHTTCGSQLVFLPNATSPCISILDKGKLTRDSVCPSAFVNITDMSCFATACFALDLGNGTNYNSSIIIFPPSAGTIVVVGGGYFRNPTLLTASAPSGRFSSTDMLVVDGRLFSTVWLVSYSSGFGSSTKVTKLTILLNLLPVVGIGFTSSSSFLIAFDQGKSLYSYNTTGYYLGKVGTFGNISAFSVDFYGRMYVVDRNCSSILIFDTNMALLYTIPMGATGLVNPKQFSHARDSLYVLDDLGISQVFFGAFVLVSCVALNDSCLDRGGGVNITISGGTNPYKYSVMPDRVSTTTAATSYRFVLTPRSTSLSAPYYIYDEINSAEYIDQYSVTSVGSRSLFVNSTTITPFRGMFSFGAQMVNYARYGFKTTTNSINTTAWERIEMMVNVGDGGQSFSIDFGATAPIYNYYPGDFPLHTWTKLTLDFSQFPAANYSSLLFTDLSGLNTTDPNINMVYFDDIVMMPYSDNLRSAQVVDFCGATLSTDSFEFFYTNMHLDFASRPTSCAVGGVESSAKQSDGSVSVAVSGGVAPYTFSWSSSDSTTNNITGQYAFSSRDVIYDNALQLPFTDSSGFVTGKNMSDSTYYKSPPYSVSMTPLASENIRFNTPYLFDAAQYSYFQFWLNGGDYGQQIINARLLRNSVFLGANTYVHKLIGLAAIPPNKWLKIQLPITPSVGTFTGIAFTASSGVLKQQPRVYIDDMVLIRNTRTVSVRDSTSCTVVASTFFVSSPPILSVVPSTTNAKCFGSSDGRVYLDVSGGTPPYSYSWPNATNVMNGLPASSLSVSVKDQNGCLGTSATTSVNIYQPPPLSLTYNVHHPQCNGEVGNATATVYGGVSPYTYTWSPYSSSTPPEVLPRITPLAIFEDAFFNGFSMDTQQLSALDARAHQDAEEETELHASAMRAASQPSTAQVVCVGATGSENNTVHSGYCSIVVREDAKPGVVLSMGCVGCVDLVIYERLEMWVKLTNPKEDGGKLMMNLTRGGEAVWSEALFDSVASLESVWTKVNMNLSQSDAKLADYISITINSPILGSILFDDIVFLPVKTFLQSTGMKVRTGFESVIVASASIYSLSIIDANSCPLKVTIALVEPPVLNISYVITKPASPRSTDGVIVVTANGGTPPYSFLWQQTESNNVTITSTPTTTTSANIHMGSYTVVVLDDHGCKLESFIFVEPVVYDVEFTMRKFDRSLSAGLAVLVCVGLLFWLFAAVMLTRNWDYFTKIGGFFSFVLVLGVAVAYASALTLLPEPTNLLCILFPWLLGVGFILVYGCLFIKTWVLYQVWTKAIQYQKTTITPAYIVKMLGMALTAEVIFMVIWTIMDPPKVHIVELTFTKELDKQCTPNTPLFWIIFVTVKGLWLVCGAVLSVLTRDLVKEYNESSNIAYAIYNNVLLGVIAVPLAILIGKVPGGRQVILVAIIVIAFTFTTVILFFKVWHRVLFAREDPIDSAMSPKNSRNSQISMSKNSKSSKSSKSSKTSVEEKEKSDTSSSEGGMSDLNIAVPGLSV